MTISIIEGAQVVMLGRVTSPHMRVLGICLVWVHPCSPKSHHSL